MSHYSDSHVELLQKCGTMQSNLLLFLLITQYQHPVQMRATAYKLPPDVELSKTTSPDDTKKVSDNDADLPTSAASDLSSLKRSTSLNRRDSTDRPKPEGQQHINAEDFKQQNGLVTLSR
jgi:hypothetical protein